MRFLLVEFSQNERKDNFVKTDEVIKQQFSWPF